MTRRRRNLTLLSGCALFVLGMAAVYAIDPAGPDRGYLPPCLWREFTGLYCPGCGATRATHALLHGDLAMAVRFNPLFVFLGLPAFLLFVIDLFVRRPRVPQRIAMVFGLSVALVALVFTVLRNLPGSQFDLLRPPAPRAASR